MKVSPLELTPSNPENTGISRVEAYTPGKNYDPEALQNIADCFQKNFPYRLYPLETEQEQLGLHKHSDQLQEQVDQGDIWLTATDPKGKVTSVLRMAERAAGQFHVYWLITDDDRRREGIGSELLEQAENLVFNGKIAENPRITASVHNENEASVRMFSSLGYEEFDQRYPEPMEVNWSAPYFTHFVKNAPMPPAEQPVAVVVGASSGFGESAAREFANRGWHVVAIATREDRLRNLAAQIGGEYVVCDITKDEEVDSMADQVLGRHKAIDALLYSAGIAMRKPLSETSPSEILEVVDTNSIGSVRVLHALQEGLEAAERADFIDIVSGAGGINNPNSGGYSASKATQRSTSRSMRHDLRGSGITVHTILPGKADTEGHPQPPSNSPISKLTRTDVDTVTQVVMDRIGKRPGEIYVPRILKGVSLAYDLAPVTVGRVVGSLLS